MCVPQPLKDNKFAGDPTGHLRLTVFASKSFIVFDLFCCRYGFRTPPHLELKARPKLGEREVTLAHVTDWIEKKLDQEFQVLINTFLVFGFCNSEPQCLLTPETSPELGFFIV